MSKHIKEQINQSLGFKIKVLNTLFEKTMNNKVSQVIPNLTHTQMSVLMFIYHSSDKPLLQKELEDVMYLSHPTVRGIVKRLEKLDFIQVDKLESDKRQTTLALTKHGQQILDEKEDKLNYILDSTEMTLDKHLSKDEKDKLSKQLDLLISNFFDE